MNTKRAYQQRDRKDILAQLGQGNNVMYQLPTGGGKSVVSSEVVHEYRTKNVLVVAHRRELILQMENRLSSDKITPGVLVGDIQRNLDSNILIGSIQTLSRQNRLDTILNKKFDLVVVDEAHHLRTPSYDKLLNHIQTLNPDVHVLGLSATPYRSDKKDFRDYIDTLITSETVDSLIEKGFLCKFRTFVTRIGDIDKEVEKNENDYNITSLSKYMRKDIFLQHLVDQYEEHGNDKQTLIYTVDRNHLEAVKQKFIDSGYDSIEIIHAETPKVERDSIIKRYEAGTLKFIASIGTMTEGVDLPETGCVLIARPTESLVLFHQIIGRGMRPKKDGSDVVILDCAGITLKHGSVNSQRVWSLDPKQDPKEKTKRNKVVGVREDGTYTTDIEEIEQGIVEVIEMTPEQYFSHNANAIEEAEQFNKDIDDKCDNLFGELIEALGTLINHIDISMKAQRVEDGYRRNELSLMLNGIGDKGDYRVDFKKVGGYLIPEASTPWRQEDPIATLKLNAMIGQLSAKMLSDKSIMKNHDKMKEEVATLREGKVDVTALKRNRKQFEREQMKLKLAKLINLNDGVVTIVKPEFGEDVRSYNKQTRNWGINLGDEFRDGWGAADTLFFPKKKMLKYNEVRFRNSQENEHGSHHMGSLELDRILDMLEGKEIK